MPGNDAFTKLLLQGEEGADGSTTIVNVAAGGSAAVTAINQAQIDTAQNKFGSGSYLFDGTDRLSVASSSDWDTTASNTAFVYECWFRSTSVALPNHLFDFGASGGGAGNRFVFSFDGTGMSIYDFAEDFSPISGSVTVSLNTWHHAAMVRQNNSVRIFLDGAQIGGTWNLEDLSGGVTYRSQFTNAAWSIGGRTNDAQHGLVGNSDEVRVSIGTDRGWYGGFTPPTAAYSAGLPRSQALIMG